MEGYIVSLIIFTAIFALFGLGLNLQWGFTGLINFGHVAFMTLGAYTTVLLSLRGVPLVIAALIGAAAAALLGLLMGLTTLRLRTDYLAIVTVGIAEMIRLVAENEQWLTQGTFGIQRFPLPLANFSPNLPVRVVMILVLLGAIALGYWQLGKTLRQRMQGIPARALRQSALAALAYLVALAASLSIVSVVARQIKLTNALPAWALGLGLLLAGVAIILGFMKLAKLGATRFEQWEKGLSWVSAIAVALFGLWLTGFAVQALYDYDRNPSKTGLMWLSVLLVAVAYWALERLVRSPWGRVLKAIREDEEVAKALGKNVFGYKLQALMLGGLIAGLAGALYAWQLTVVFPVQFDPLITFNAWTIVVLGGAGSNAGTLLGATIFWGYDTLTRFGLREIIPLEDSALGAFRVMVIGLILMVLMAWRPQGILGKKEELTLGR
ncbi:MAG: branched-chain amino acid ABC transporter permease [Oculatellaceae cyanobacterium Prado106]|jgi:neutral amino acid transport system permease protein|nr:branched-chain amino acid ABC transporter permease [Oculatellaceae cyanobacterium Prado106]